MNFSNKSFNTTLMNSNKSNTNMASSNTQQLSLIKNTTLYGNKTQPSLSNFNQSITYSKDYFNSALKTYNYSQPNTQTIQTNQMVDSKKNFQIKVNSRKLDIEVMRNYMNQQLNYLKQNIQNVRQFVFLNKSQFNDSLNQIHIIFQQKETPLSQYFNSKEVRKYQEKVLTLQNNNEYYQQQILHQSKIQNINTQLQQLYVRKQQILQQKQDFQQLYVYQQQHIQLSPNNSISYYKQYQIQFLNQLKHAFCQAISLKQKQIINLQKIMLNDVDYLQLKSEYQLQSQYQNVLNKEICNIFKNDTLEQSIIYTNYYLKNSINSYLLKDETISTIIQQLNGYQQNHINQTKQQTKEIQRLKSETEQRREDAVMANKYCNTAKEESDTMKQKKCEFINQIQATNMKRFTDTCILQKDLCEIGMLWGSLEVNIRCQESEKMLNYINICKNGIQCYQNMYTNVYMQNEALNKKLECQKQLIDSLKQFYTKMQLKAKEMQKCLKPGE